MDWQDYNESILAMNILDASEKLWDLRVSQFPNTKKNSQERLLRDLKKQHDQGLESSKGSVISNEQLARIISGR